MEDVLDTFERRIRNALDAYLLNSTDRVYWEQNNKFRYRNAREMNEVLVDAFTPMYEKYPKLEKVLDDSLMLLQQCAWVGMNVPWPVDPDDHIQRVVDNVMEVFNIIVYGNLRFEILNLDHEGSASL
jgi:hypothetical protein